MFAKPIPIGPEHVWLVVPLCAVAAVVYKAIRVRRLRQLPLQLLGLWAYMAVGLTALAVVFFLLLEYIA